MYVALDRPSIAPEGAVAGAVARDAVFDPQRALVVEAMDYNLLFRWFVGLNADEEV